MLAPSAGSVRVVDRGDYALTNHRALCRRGVLWIGQTCNLRCHFCYSLDKITSPHHPEHDFLPLDKLKEMCRTLVEVYGHNSVDIQGGEPTLYPDIVALLQYCNEIGLKPTLITNGQVLSEPERVRELKEAGIHDFLISIHGLGRRYDKIVVVDGASEKLLEGINNVAAAGVPFRLNCVLCQDVLPDLADVATLAVEKGARVVNFIALNPFIDQACRGKRSTDNVPRYGDVRDALLPVIDFLDERGVEVNVRHLPFCLFPEKYRKFIQNFQQTAYDLHEWESAGEAWSGGPSQRQAEGPLSAPVDFFRRLETLRLIAAAAEAGKSPEQHGWRSAVSTTLDVLEERVEAAGPRLTVALYGSGAVGQTFMQAASTRDSLRLALQFTAFISSAAYRMADTLNGLPWETPEWLANEPPDVILNTSESSRDAISATLGAMGLGERTIEIFGHLGKTATPGSSAEHPILQANGRPGYQYLPYLPELGPFPNSGVLEQAYKEYQVLMPKTMHAYVKGEACGRCSLNGICDGFHEDYVEIFGFGEAQAQTLPRRVFAPTHYSREQLKVVERQEYDWALPVEHSPTRQAEAVA